MGINVVFYPGSISRRRFGTINRGLLQRCGRRHDDTPYSLSDNLPNGSTNDLPDNRRSDEKSYEKSYQESDKESDQESYQKPDKKSNQEPNQESDEESDQKSDKESNQESNRESSLKTKREKSQYILLYPSRSSNGLNRYIFLCDNPSSELG